MTECTILVLEDEERNRTEYQRKLSQIRPLSDKFKIETLDEPSFKTNIIELMQRHKDNRAGKWEPNEIEIDNASILIIDYDLLELDKDNFYITGDDLAYLGRCFSKCGLIVGLSQQDPNPFDLNFKNDISSFSDLFVGSNQITNPGLWCEEWIDFRPWAWPILPLALASFMKRLELVEKKLDNKIIDILGLPEDIVQSLPDAAIDFIGGDLKEVSFREFVMESNNGIKKKDANDIDEIHARIASARIAQWLEALVLPGQNILIDAPHLVMKYPSLLTGDVSQIETWNQTTRLNDAEDLGIKNDLIESFNFKQDCWLSRKTWFWNKVNDCQDIQEVSEPWTKQETKYLFCEDSSCFHNANNCKQFHIELDSPFRRRYVKGFEAEGVTYRPRVKFISRS